MSLFTQIRGNTVKDGTIAEVDLGLSDVTTLNVDSSKHGFMPKLTGDENRVLFQDGAVYDSQRRMIAYNTMMDMDNVGRHTMIVETPSDYTLTPTMTPNSQVWRELLIKNTGTSVINIHINTTTPVVYTNVGSLSLAEGEFRVLRWMMIPANGTYGVPDTTIIDVSAPQGIGNFPISGANTVLACNGSGAVVWSPNIQTYGASNSILTFSDYSAGLNSSYSGSGSAWSSVLSQSDTNKSLIAANSNVGSLVSHANVFAYCGNSNSGTGNQNAKSEMNVSGAGGGFAAITLLADNVTNSAFIGIFGNTIKLATSISDNSNTIGKVWTCTAVDGAGGWATAAGGGETLVTSVSSLTSINCSLGSFYLISLSASATFSFANVTANKVYSFEITNITIADITITIPTGAVATNPTFTVSPNTKRIFQMIYVNSVYDFEVGNMKGTV